MTDGPLAAYRARLASGDVIADPRQVAAAEHLDLLAHALARGDGGLSRILPWTRRARPRGLYIHGPVGRGKSMLMDLFFAAAPIAQKRRIHFNAFMLDVHERLEAERAGYRRNPRAEAPVVPLVRALAREAQLLCLDEFQVADIADAMILSRLFSGLFAQGIVLVATSNTAPEDLYAGGLQRELFLPFIDVLNRTCDVFNLDGPRDYRLMRHDGLPVYYVPAAGAEADLDAAFAALTDRAAGISETVSLKQRSLSVPRAARGVARFSFADLCEQPLGAADYLALAARFHTIILAGIPVMVPERRNEARRFVTLIDTLYDHGINLIASADGPPESLYVAGDGSREFARTASRMIEMQSASYHHTRHHPPAAPDTAQHGSEFS